METEKRQGTDTTGTLEDDLDDLLRRASDTEPERVRRWSLRQIASSILGGIGTLYVICGVLTAMYFSSFTETGDMGAGIKGTFWPYFVYREVVIDRRVRAEKEAEKRYMAEVDKMEQ